MMCGIIIEEYACGCLKDVENDICEDKSATPLHVCKFKVYITLTDNCRNHAFKNVKKAIEKRVATIGACTVA